jgi:hypothetical protein
VIAILAAGMSLAAAVLLARPGPVTGCWSARLRRACRQEAMSHATGATRAAGEAGPVQTSAPGPRAVEPTARLTVPMVLDLVAEVVASGASPVRALVAVGESLERVCDPSGADLLRTARRLSGADGGSMSVGQPGTRAVGQPAAGSVGGQSADALARALALSVVTGAGPVTLIRAAAQEHRRRVQAEQTQAAHRLGVLVLLPTGLCLLPAFVLLTVVPIVIDLVLG